MPLTSGSHLGAIFAWGERLGTRPAGGWPPNAAVAAVVIVGTQQSTVTSSHPFADTSDQSRASQPRSYDQQTRTL